MLTRTLLICLYLADGNVVLINSPIIRGANNIKEQRGILGQSTELLEKDLARTTLPSPNLDRSRIGRCPPPSRAFTGREDILNQMREYFFENSPMNRRLFVLCGLGGAGKTQLALIFAQIHRDE